MFRRVLFRSNLVNNALRYGKRADVRVHVAGDEVHIVIEDEGPGIPEDKLKAIFDRFYTERPEGEKFGTHSGLGLSISQQIVEAHNGTLTASNRRDRSSRIIGARFTIDLPAI